ncbi:MAG: hypothetical protein F6J90_39635 [Moorea sp. SIOASIH]|nr:hypothetical protein [Moorena sp. SIOASIH]
MIHLEVGYDAAKQVKGRKRHLVVDTLGLKHGCSRHGSFFTRAIRSEIIIRPTQGNQRAISPFN